MGSATLIHSETNVRRVKGDTHLALLHATLRGTLPVNTTAAYAALPRHSPRFQLSSGHTRRLRQADTTWRGRQEYRYLPEFVATDALAQGRVAQVLPGLPCRSVAIHALYPSGRNLPNKVRVLVDFLVEALRRMA